MTDELTLIEYAARRGEVVCQIKYTTCKATNDGRLELTLAETSRTDYGGRKTLLLTPASRRDDELSLRVKSISCQSLDNTSYKIVEGDLFSNSVGQNCQLVSFIRTNA